APRPGAVRSARVRAGARRPASLPQGPAGAEPVPREPPMKVGMNLPVMVPGLTRDLVREWCRRVDAGPFSSIAAGERIAFPNPEIMVTLSAAAAWTERVDVGFHVLVPPMHEAVLLAKQVATLDVLSGGRVCLGVGVGARHE